MTRIPIEKEKLFATLTDLIDTTTDFELDAWAERMLNSCAELLSIWATGLVLADGSGSTRAYGSAPEVIPVLTPPTGSVNLAEEALRTDTVLAISASSTDSRGPECSQELATIGAKWAYIVPMQVREHELGVLVLLLRDAPPLTEAQLRVARVVADMGTIGIVNSCAHHRTTLRAEQLQTALDTRVLIEQAKGILAERTGESIEWAFNHLQALAHSTKRPIADVATEFVQRNSKGQVSD